MSVLEQRLPAVDTHDDLPLEYAHEDDALRIFGFWVFLVTDMLLFSCVFATYVILYRHTNMGPTPTQLFDVRGFTAETLILLTSSFTSGIGTYEMRRGHRGALIGWLMVTWMLGACFIGLEVSEFVADVASGATMSRSAFLSAFFTLVGM